MKVLKVVVLNLLLVLLGCKGPAPQMSPLASPLPTSPIATPLPPTAQALPEFRLDTPLQVGDTRVSGVGVAGVPILIIDVSRMTELGYGTVDKDNRFSVKIQEPLVKYSIIGVMLDESRTSPYTAEQLPCGETCRDQPLVGRLLTRAPVTQP